MAIDFVKPKPGETWRLRITSGTRLDDKSLIAGQIIEVPVRQAIELMAANRAVRHHEPENQPAPATVGAEPVGVKGEDPEAPPVTSGAPKPPRGGKKNSK